VAYKIAADSWKSRQSKTQVKSASCRPQWRAVSTGRNNLEKPGKAARKKDRATPKKNTWAKQPVNAFFGEAHWRKERLDVLSRQ